MAEKKVNDRVGDSSPTLITRSFYTEAGSGGEGCSSNRWWDFREVEPPEIELLTGVAFDLDYLATRYSHCSICGKPIRNETYHGQAIADEMNEVVGLCCASKLKRTFGEIQKA